MKDVWVAGSALFLDLDDILWVKSLSSTVLFCAFLCVLVYTHTSKKRPKES